MLRIVMITTFIGGTLGLLAVPAILMFRSSGLYLGTGSRELDSMLYSMPGPAALVIVAVIWSMCGSAIGAFIGAIFGAVGRTR
jgi:hypothetical protein